jgi:hypothetical protein
MPVRKNAKFLSAAEREDFVKACVLMKADIVNPGAPAVQQYSVWDQNVAIHNEIQNAFAPGAPAVNFGHGGSGAPGGPGPGTDLIPPGCDADCPLEQFTRILNASVAVID